MNFALLSQLTDNQDPNQMPNIGYETLSATHLTKQSNQASTIAGEPRKECIIQIELNADFRVTVTALHTAVADQSYILQRTRSLKRSDKYIAHTFLSCT